jgi:hypothetical protein
MPDFHAPRRRGRPVGYCPATRYHPGERPRACPRCRGTASLVISARTVTHPDGRATTIRYRRCRNPECRRRWPTTVTR